MNGRLATEAVYFAVDIAASVSERALQACAPERPEPAC